MSFGLRRVELRDLSTLRDLSIKTFVTAFGSSNTEANINKYTSSAFSEEKLREEIQETYSHFYFCVFNSDIVGYMKLNFAPAQSDINDPQTLELERIYVLREHQNKQAGRYMVERAVEIASRAKIKVVWLGVWEKNTAAIRFYERNLFTPAGSHAFMLGNEEQIDIIMQRIL
jgi:ribosomal protein S18 acetylase RimI-like enzyme